MSDSDIVSQLARFEVHQKFRHAESRRNRQYQSPTPVKRQVADRMLDWGQLNLIDKHNSVLPKLTNCVACVLLNHIDEIRRSTGLVPQFYFCNLTAPLAGKAPFALKSDQPALIKTCRICLPSSSSCGTGCKHCRLCVSGQQLKQSPWGVVLFSCLSLNRSGIGLDFHVENAHTLE